MFVYTWSSFANATYYLHVRGLNNVNFRLIVTDEPTAQNESCDDAIKVDPGSSIVGSNAGSAFDFLTSDACGLGSDLPGIWYMVEGNGQLFTINMCSRNAVPISFGVVNDCDSLSCNGHSTFGIALCDYDDSIVYTWNTEVGVNYFIHVRGEGDVEFVMKVTAASSVVNNECVNAIPVDLGMEVDGTNEGANFDFVDEDLCGARSDLPAVWYEVIGNGFEYEASVCSTNSLSLDFGIFEGCDKRDCVGSPEGAAGFSCSKYSFHTFIEESYYIQIRGQAGVGFKVMIAESGSPSTIKLWLWAILPACLFICFLLALM